MKLWKHQKRMLDHALNTPKDLTYAGMSTGKTLFALEYLRQIGNGLRLVITPKPALSVWKEDVDKFYGGDYDIHVLDKGTSRSKANLIAGLDRGVVVTNYATAALLPLHQYQWDAVVCDEAHRLAKHNGKHSTVIANALRNVPYKVAMTGTAYHDGYEKIYGMMRYLETARLEGRQRIPRLLMQGKPVTYNQFLEMFCDIFWLNRNAPIINSYKNLDALAQWLKPYVIHVKTEDVIDLPKLVVRRYSAPLTGDAKKAYKQMADDSVVELDNGLAAIAPHRLTQLIRLQQLATSGQLVNEDKTVTNLSGVEQRLNLLQELLEPLQHEPVVIFTRFQRDVEFIAKLFKEPVAKLTGDEDTHNEWKAGQYRVLIANIAAGSEGVRLQRAKHVIFWSVGYSNKDFQQAIARLRRADQQSDTVFMTVITSENTIDEDIYQVLSQKNDRVDELDRRLTS